MKLSRESGFDRKKKRAEVIEIEQENLWSKKILGDENPRQLVSTFVYLSGNNFALRGRDEHRRLQMDNIRKEYDDLAGRNYLLYVESIAKNSKGGLVCMTMRGNRNHLGLMTTHNIRRGALFECIRNTCHTVQMELMIYLTPVSVASGTGTI